MASIKPNWDREPVNVDPSEIYFATYDPTSPIRLRIATGGAGQSGLIRALADVFITDQVSRAGHKPFRVAWLASDTSASFNYLASRSADLSITYHPSAEKIAISQGIADRSVYAWRDHWMLVGPKSNPAQLTTDTHASINDLFAQIFQGAIETAGSHSSHPVRFLSRYDKSANNIKESSIWAAIGQTPWSHPCSTWYHKYVEFPFQALRAASDLGEYTITDRGTWFAVESSVRNKMVVFKEGGDADNDLMLNPAHVLVGKYGANKEMADEFANWLARADGGQKVIENFEVNGVILYSKAPSEQGSLLKA